MSQDEGAWLDCMPLNNNEYRFSSSIRPDRQGGGVALLYKSFLKVRMMEEGNLATFQYVIWSITQSNENINMLLVAIYHPPYSMAKPVTNASFIDEFSNWLPDKLLSHKNIIIAGDFNLHVNDPNNEDAGIFLDTLTALGLVQHVAFPTHRSDNTLDLIITEICNGISVKECRSGPSLLDHCAVKCITSIPKENVKQQLLSFRKLKTIDTEAFQRDLSLESITTSNLDDMVMEYGHQMRATLDKHAPVITRNTVVRHTNLWFNDDLKNQKKKVRHREKIWRRYKLDSNWTALKVERSKYRHMLKQARITSIKDEINDCRGDTKKLYKLVANLTNTASQNPLPETLDDELLANEFAEFFIGKIQKIRNDLDDLPLYEPSESAVPTFSSFKPMSSEEVLKVITSMPSKSCELDEIPMNLLKKIAPSIVEFITKLVNVSLGQGVFTSSWKITLVKPLLKKVGLELIKTNFRPVSNLPFLSKLIEKCMLAQFNNHCAQHNLLPDYQLAYHEDFSCEMALVRLVDKALWAMEHQRVTAVAVIDLSAAFDTVDHSVLLKVLKAKYGITDSALVWYDSYLRPRGMQVQIRGQCSKVQDLWFSVPQGSCGGPTLYSAYASTIQEVVPTTVSINGFANDHSLDKSFPGASRTEENNTIQTLESTLNDIKGWMDSNRLKMNNKKTEFLMLGSCQQLQKCTSNSIQVCGESIERSKMI